MKKTIGIVLTKSDDSIIAWLNMLEKAGESHRSWIQAILLADFLKEDIDAGTVYVPKRKQQKQLKPPSSKHMMFGDDSPESKQSSKVRYGWRKESDKAKYTAGNILSITVTRSAMVPVLERIDKKTSNTSSYIKAILRKYIKTTTDENEEIVPDKTDIQDLFVLNAGPKEPKKKPAGDTGDSKPILPPVKAPVSETPKPPEPKKRRNPLLEYINN